MVLRGHAGALHRRGGSISGVGALSSQPGAAHRGSRGRSRGHALSQVQPTRSMSSRTLGLHATAAHACRAVTAACPALRRFQPAWWARGPHAQMLAMALTAPPESVYQRQMFTLPGDGVQVALDWKEDDTMTAATPIIVCLHGMGGCRESQYLRVFTDSALRRGYRAVVYNRRGHGGTSLLPADTPGTTPGLTPRPAGDEGPRPVADGGPRTPPKVFPKHSNMDDMVAVIQHICALYPEAPKFLIGFSCGANLAVNYLAHSGASCPFIATASVSNGYDIYHGTSLLRERDAVSDGVGAQFLKGLLLEGRLEECQQLAAEAGVKIDWKAVMNSKSIQELEGQLVVPAYGYSCLKEYYDEDSCHKRIQTVQAPLLCICARRDPLVVEDLVEVPRSAAKANPHILTVITKHGGHMGWITRMSEEPWYLTLYFQYIKAVQAAKEDGSGVKTAAVAAGQQQVAVPSGEGENIQTGTSGQRKEPMHVPGTSLEAGAATQVAADAEASGADACSNGAGKSQAIPDSQGGAATSEALTSVKVA